MQKLIVSNDRVEFDRRVNEALDEGCAVVPGTLTMAMTSHRKRGNEGGNFLQSRYAVIVGRPGEPVTSERSDDEAIAAGPGSLCQPAEPEDDFPL